MPSFFKNEGKKTSLTYAERRSSKTTWWSLVAGGPKNPNGFARKFNRSRWRQPCHFTNKLELQLCVHIIQSVRVGWIAHRFTKTMNGGCWQQPPLNYQFIIIVIATSLWMKRRRKKMLLHQEKIRRDNWEIVALQCGKEESVGTVRKNHKKIFKFHAISGLFKCLPSLK